MAHATFQEYYSALYAAAFGTAELDRYLHQAFASASRLITLEFLAGIAGPASQRLASFAAEQLGNPDRFRQVLLRVARLVAAGKWQDEVGQAVREQLWQEITSDDDMSLTKAAVEAYAAIDAIQLCQRAQNARSLPSWALNCLIETLPPTLVKKMNLASLLPGRWQDYAGVELRGEVDDEELKLMRAVLTARSAREEKRYEAITFAGAVRDEQAVPGLLFTLTNKHLPIALRVEVLDSLAAIGTRSAIDTLVDVVTGDTPLDENGMRTAAATLRNTQASRKALDPIGRDRLLRRLAIIPLNSASIGPILAALEGHPIREGAELILEIAETQEISEGTREQAIRTLASAADRTLPIKALAAIEKQPRALQNALLDLAIQRRLPVAFDFLQDTIRGCKDRVELHQQLKRFVMLMGQSEGGQRDQSAAFLHLLITRALQHDSRSDELCKALTAALAMSDHTVRLRLGADSAELACECLRQFIAQPAETREGPVVLAAAVLGHSADRSAAPLLKTALDSVLQLESDESGSKRNLQLASSLVNCLIHLTPEVLLPYPGECEPVQLALRAAAIQRGWLVFSERILNAEGRVVAEVGRGFEPMQLRPQPTPIRDLANAPIRLGEESEKELKLLEFFYRLGLEFERGAASLSEVSRRLEAEDGKFPGSKGAASKLRDEIMEFFQQHDQTDEPLFIRARRGLAEAGLTERGKEAWERTKALLRQLGIIPEDD